MAYKFYHFDLHIISGSMFEYIFPLVTLHNLNFGWFLINFKKKKKTLTLNQWNIARFRTNKLVKFPTSQILKITSSWNKIRCSYRITKWHYSTYFLSVITLSILVQWFAISQMLDIRCNFFTHISYPFLTISHCKHTLLCWQMRYLASESSHMFRCK